MNGRLGGIYIGTKQVGGFLDWRMQLNVVKGTEGNDQTNRVQSWRVLAWAHWMTTPMEPNTEVTVRLCADEGLVYWEALGRVVTRTTPDMGVLVHNQIEVTGSGELAGKKMANEK